MRYCRYTLFWMLQRSEMKTPKLFMYYMIRSHTYFWMLQRSEMKPQNFLYYMIRVHAYFHEDTSTP
jgi:hypothetical protein